MARGIFDMTICPPPNTHTRLCLTMTFEYTPIVLSVVPAIPIVLYTMRTHENKGPTSEDLLSLIDVLG